MHTILFMTLMKPGCLDRPWQRILFLVTSLHEWKHKSGPWGVERKSLHLRISIENWNRCWSVLVILAKANEHENTNLITVNCILSGLIDFHKHSKAMQWCHARDFFSSYRNIFPRRRKWFLFLMLGFMDIKEFSFKIWWI